MFRNFEIKFGVCKKQYRIDENKLGHNMYRCYQSHMGNIDKRYECYTKGDGLYKGLDPPDLEYIKNKYRNAHESLANLIFT
jgi:hypothetical protein